MPLTLRDRAMIVVGLLVLSLFAELAERLDRRERARALRDHRVGEMR